MTARAGDDRVERAAQVLADGLAARVARWAHAGGADGHGIAVLRRAARDLALAHADGHVCLPLADLVAGLLADEGADAAAIVPSGDDADAAQAALRRTLRASPLVGDGQLPLSEPLATPLVLDKGDRLYLARDFDHERRLADRLAGLAASPPLPMARAAAEQLRRLFAGPQAGPDGRLEADGQQLAAALALHRRLVVISGGPGTGKTTTVVNLLACLLAAEPGCRIALAAPTGKAAARMTEALRERAAHLPPALQEALPREARTVHRLLGVRPGPERFLHHAGHPLALDTLVIDEASMLDLALMRRLLDAVPPQARVILLGDKDQLSAVESGAVFAEMSTDASLSAGTRAALAPLCGVSPDDLPSTDAAPPGPLQDSTVWLTRSHRFSADSGIGRLAAEVNGGRVQAALATLRAAGSGSDVHWIEDEGNAPSAEAWQRITEGFADYVRAIRRDPTDREGVARAWSSFMLLTAVRGGGRGLETMGQRLEAHVRSALGGGATAPDDRGRSPWFVGRPVMVRRNEPALRLFNGDVGFLLPDRQGRWQVWFPDVAVGGDTPGWRAVAPARLPPHETALAMTVHKAQGSEFDRVALLLPAQAGRVLTRELIYTGVTRARQAVTLIGAAGVLASGISTRTQRRSGLLARLDVMQNERAAAAAGQSADPTV